MRICLIGAGRAGRVHANSIARHIAGAELAAVVDGRAGDRRKRRRRLRHREKLRQRDGRARLGRVRCGRHHHADLHASRLRGCGGKRRQACLSGKADGADARRMRRDHRRGAESRRRAADRLHAPLRSGFPAGLRAHQGRRDRPADDREIADARPRPAAALGARHEALERHARRSEQPRLGLRPLARRARTRRACSSRPPTSRAQRAASTIPTSTTPRPSRSASTTARSARSPASAPATTATTRASRSSAKRASCRSAR